MLRRMTYRSRPRKVAKRVETAPPEKPAALPVKVSPPLSWAIRYLRKAKKRMPSLPLPKQIRSYKPPLNREMRVWATCGLHTKVITIATHRPVTVAGSSRKRRHVAIPQRELLMTLAHELAHLRHEFHDYEQESYARAIFQAFGLNDKCPHCGGAGKVPARYVN